MDFDTAQENFRKRPSLVTATDYLNEALEYWCDEMISDGTFKVVVGQVVDYIRAQAGGQ
jgi:hypothetical protein